MLILDLIEKKKNKIELNKEEYFWFIKSLINNELVDYQISALLMAIFINGMNDEELFSLIEALMENSDNVEGIPTNFLNISIDKHSSGGVGDKVSLILSPILVALGYDVIKLSGRGLSFTGGTIDKLESIGINYEYKKDTFQHLLDQCHMSLMIQSQDIVPGDKKLYALRDVTGTIDSLPLIAASIMSKKLIVNSEYIFLDIKIGEGAFLKTIEEGRKFADIILKISKKFNRKTIIHLTNMTQPLGRAIGNAIEIKETIEFLNNNYESQNLKELIFGFASDILLDTNVVNSEQEAIKRIEEVLKSKKAFNAFIKFIKTFSNNPNVIEENKYFNPKNQYEIFAEKDGYLMFNSVKNVGLSSNLLGAGRFSKEDSIDYNAGIKLHFEPNTYVNKGSKIATLYSNKSINKEIVIKFKKSLTYTDKQIDIGKIIIEKIK